MKEKVKKKIKLFLGYILSFAVMGGIAAAGWYGEETYYKTLEMKYAVIQTVAQQIFPRVILWIAAAVLIKFLWTMREEIQKKLPLQQWMFWVLIGIYVVLFIVHFGCTAPDYLASYSINGESQSFVQILINQKKDIQEKDYETMEFDSFEFASQSVSHKIRRGAYETEYPYLEINQGEYVLPLPKWDDKYIYNLLSVPIEKHKIKVYKHTKFIVEVDGFKINELKERKEEIQEYVEEKTKEYNAKYKKTWCTLTVDEDDLISVTLNCQEPELNYAVISYCDSSGEEILALGLEDNKRTLEKRQFGKSGKGFQVYARDRFGERISNIIQYDIVEEDASNITYIQ